MDMYPLGYLLIHLMLYPRAKKACGHKKQHKAKPRKATEAQTQTAPTHN
jgi:hypothetical protein